MKEKVLAHMGSLMGGMVHNLNTPLMWIMGRSQLLQARNERIEALIGQDPEGLSVIREKNIKDITSIQDGADKIDRILKSLGYKIQMVNEGYTSIELREFLEMETGFLMADMRFKHETVSSLNVGERSCYVKCDYNALCHAFTGIIDAVIRATQKGRKLDISLDGGAIRLKCPGLEPTPELMREIEKACQELATGKDLVMEGVPDGLEISLWVKDGGRP